MLGELLADHPSTMLPAQKIREKQKDILRTKPCHPLDFKSALNQERSTPGAIQQLFDPGFSAQQFAHPRRQPVDVLLRPFLEPSGAVSRAAAAKRSLP
jgi:hypothetical protein